MNISLNWLNRYLEPSVRAEEAEEALTHAGFPFESVTPLPSGDFLLDVEITSNRGDCLSHLGLAREIAARTGRQFRPPAPPAPRRDGEVADALVLDNRVPALCPRFTAQVIRGVKVGPSPAWLVELLDAVGQRSINNIVDVTNWLTFEYGQPAHVFDLGKLAGPALIIRHAAAGEALATLDGKRRKLDPSDVVVADAERAQSLAGVIGGAETEVTESTADIVLEAACWDPPTVRATARRLGIRTDAGHRFERGVDPRTVDEPAHRAAAMILDLAGGTLLGGGDEDGLLIAGPALPEEMLIDLRPSRCAAILGYRMSASEIISLLRRLDIGVDQVDEDTFRCTVPPFRLDLAREIDLIEEVARIAGFDRIELAEKLPVSVAAPQESERAVREVGSLLASLGFYETVTFSFVAREQADAFLPEGLERVEVDDERRKAEPALRPSILPGLLACRKANQDGRVEVDGGIRLFETAAVFAQGVGRLSEPSASEVQRLSEPSGQTHERRTLALLMDAPGDRPEHVQEGVRLLRGAVEALARTAAGATAELRPDKPPCRAWDTHAYARILLDGQDIGELGLIGPGVLRMYDLDRPVVGAELDLEALIAGFPPRAAIRPLPAFPGIERDLSVIVEESVPWARIAGLVEEAGIGRLEGFGFVGTYRGKQVGPGRKSVTLRLSFRDPSRTLQHAEVDPEVATVLGVLKAGVGAELRA